MKVAVTTGGPDWDAPVDSRFGRAKKFAVVDVEPQTLTVHDNSQNLNAAQGAGIQSAQKVVELGVDAVISGHCGPKAFRVLKAAGIRIYTTQAATVKEAVDLFATGKLAEAADADVEGHW